MEGTAESGDSFSASLSLGISERHQSKMRIVIDVDSLARTDVKRLSVSSCKDRLEERGLRSDYKERRGETVIPKNVCRSR